MGMIWLSSIIVECYRSHDSHNAMGYCYFAHPLIHTMLRHGGKNSLKIFLSHILPKKDYFYLEQNLSDTPF